MYTIVYSRSEEEVAPTIQTFDQGHACVMIKPMNYFYRRLSRHVNGLFG